MDTNPCSKQRVILMRKARPGTLYDNLKNCWAAGIVEESLAAAAGEDPRRRYYAAYRAWTPRIGGRDFQIGIGPPPRRMAPPPPPRVLTGSGRFYIGRGGRYMSLVARRNLQRPPTQEADHGHQKKFDSVADVRMAWPMRGTASARFSGTIWREMMWNF